MIISQLVESLMILKDKYGDLPIYAPDTCKGYPHVFEVIKADVVERPINQGEVLPKGITIA